MATLLTGRCRVDAFVPAIERAVKDDRVTSLSGVLARLHAGGAFDDPSLFAPASAEHYTRNLVWKHPDNHFVIVTLTWAPGQASPLHDHAGLWGAEIIVEGSMRETSFRLVDRDAEGRYRFIRERERLIETGGVGTLVPPLEYHDFGNAGEVTSRSLHVYGGNLDRCRSFTQETDGWWTAKTVNLSYDG